MSAHTSNDGADRYGALARPFHDARSEELIAAFWQEHDTFRRSIAQRDGAPDWVFYEGPPTANGMPGVHHVMARLCKDVMCRFKTMTGHRVLRKAGWDTHGLPVERSVEKTLGIQGAEAIREFGLEEFNARCRESVWACKSDWDEFTERVGYWVDLDDPYITYDDKLHRVGVVDPDAVPRQGPALRGPQGGALLPGVRHAHLQPRDGQQLPAGGRPQHLRAPAGRRRATRAS